MGKFTKLVPRTDLSRSNMVIPIFFSIHAIIIMLMSSINLVLRVNYLVVIC